MKRLHKLASKLSHWYRSLTIEVPIGYGDPVPPEVEKFQETLSEKKDPPDPTLDGQKHPVVKQG